MNIDQVQNLIRRAARADLSQIKNLQILFEAVKVYEDFDKEGAHKLNKKVRQTAAKYAQQKYASDFMQVHKDALLFDAYDDLDAAIQYAEWDREYSKQFYLPRRKQLYPIVKQLERLERREITTLGIMAPPGIGKTTVAIMFLVWSGCRRPELSIFCTSHSNPFLETLYAEILRMLDPKGEYLWADIFPKSTVQRTNAKDMRINLDNPKRFDTFQFSSIGSNIAGKVRASNLVYADDLVGNLEEAMSRERMDKLTGSYFTDARQRAIGDWAELLIQTPWSLYDPIDTIERQQSDDPKSHFIHLPALNENDESNFDYPMGLGFSTEAYHKLRDSMDEASWNALYMTRPIEREGLLYNMDELKVYSELPDMSPDGIIAACDMKDTGKDYCVMPVAYQYGDEYYIEDIVCNNGALDMVDAQLVSTLLRHKVNLARFESNAMGGRAAQKIQHEVKAKGGITTLSGVYHTQNKETRMVYHAPFVKQHFRFNERKMQTDRQYRDAIGMLCSYSLMGKNKHDDVPDAFAMLAEFAEHFARGMKVKILDRKW